MRRKEKRYDTEFEEFILDKVRPCEDGGWEIQHSAYVFFCPANSSVTPRVGSRARFYGKGFGYQVRGLDIDGVEVYYRTAAEQEAKLDREIAKAKQKRIDEYEAKREDYDARVAALPTLFRERIEKFRKQGDKWRYEYEPYELFVCEEAVKFANALKTEDALVAWAKLDYEDQKKAVDLGDGHSGNTFGAAVMLARLYVSKPEFVTQMHGAITPLVGCKEFGCH